MDLIKLKQDGIVSLDNWGFIINKIYEDVPFVLNKNNLVDLQSINSYMEQVREYIINYTNKNDIKLEFEDLIELQSYFSKCINYTLNELNEEYIEFVKRFENSENLNCFISDYFRFKNDKKSSIYFIQNKDNGLVKIGYTKNKINTRLKQLENSFVHVGIKPVLEVLAIIPCNDKIVTEYENVIHLKLKKHRCIGEWFDINLDGIANILNDNYIHNKDDGLNYFYNALPDYVFKKDIKYLYNSTQKELLNKYFIRKNDPFYNFYEFTNKINFSIIKYNTIVDILSYSKN